MMTASTTIVSFPELGWGPWTINRFLVEDLFGKVSIAWYGVIICVAMILACAIILRNAVKKEGLNADSFLDYFIITIPVGVLGARAMYVLAKLEEYESFADMIAIWNGGLAIYGGVIAGAITVLVIAKIKKHNPLAVFDSIIPGLLIAQSLGRWGNFINGEAYGETVTHAMPWGMVVNGVGPVHPTFLYESIITFVGFCLAQFLIYRLKKSDGQVFAFYLIWYGAGRTLVEGLRVDSLMIGPLRLAQCIGLASALAGVALFVILGLYGKPKAALAAGASPENGEKAAEEVIAEEAPAEEAVVEKADSEEAPTEEDESEPMQEQPKKEKKAKKEKKKKAKKEKDEDAAA
ncbi:MAG: prolipoprotein diacylglyceryl transferase, partial [Clostridia bacterium]|nr:prolipoprotein diacylglyceryl transferase [Clostridia bacterium]